MVIKGQSVAGAKRLSVHLQRTDTNERAELLELRGVVASDLEAGLREVEAVASGTRCQKPFYHASINTRADERLSDEQRWRAINRLEQELGLTGQPRAVMLHEKEGREHCHIVWSRIDLDRMAAISDSHNYRRHELVARELEREFGHARVQGVHIERDGPRPARTPSHAEMQMTARGGVSPEAAKDLMTSIWQRTDNGASFRKGLEEQGWLLARGDRRDYVALDPAGCVHSLARRIDGARAADIRLRMADLEGAELPGVAEARRLQAAGRTLSQPRATSIDQGVVDRRPALPETGASPGAAQGVAWAVPKAAGKLADRLADAAAGLVETLGGAAPLPASGLKADHRDSAAEQASEDLFERMRRDIEQGKGISPADVDKLTRLHMMQLKDSGDAHLQQAITDRERRDRDEDRSRERDR